MTRCVDCKWWLEGESGEYGECRNAQHVRQEIHNMEIAYHYSEDHQMSMLKYYRPYITDKHHRCEDGEAA